MLMMSKTFFVVVLARYWWKLLYFPKHFWHITFIKWYGQNCPGHVLSVWSVNGTYGLTTSSVYSLQQNWYTLLTSFCASLSTATSWSCYGSRALSFYNIMYGVKHVMSEENCPLRLDLVTFFPGDHVVQAQLLHQQSCCLSSGVMQEKTAEKGAPGCILAPSQGQMRPDRGGPLWGPWLYRAQNKTQIAVGFLSPPTHPPREGTATRFSQKDAFYGAASCWRAASVCSADFNCLSVAVKEPVKYTTVKELQAGARCILEDGDEQNTELGVDGEEIRRWWTP